MSEDKVIILGPMGGTIEMGLPLGREIDLFKICAGWILPLIKEMSSEMIHHDGCLRETIEFLDSLAKESDRKSLAYSLAIWIQGEQLKTHVMMFAVAEDVKTFKDFYSSITWSALTAMFGIMASAGPGPETALPKEFRAQGIISLVREIMRCHMVLEQCKADPATWHWNQDLAAPYTFSLDSKVPRGIADPLWKRVAGELAMAFPIPTPKSSGS